MPEGDTIWRAARALHAALAGRPVASLRSPLHAVSEAARRLRIAGRTVEGVEAVGKHLLVRFEGGSVLHTHMGMSGSWSLHGAGGEGSRALASAHRVAIETDVAVAMCRRAPVVELLSRREVAAHPALSRLGPDLLAPDFDPSEARARLRARAHVEIGVALMDQTALAGIGNVYKSEVLHRCQVSPFRRVEDLDDAALDALVRIAGDLMRRNLGPGPRRTTSPLAPRALSVYGRAGRPCPRCGTPILRARQGEQARSSYWCPRCQPPPGAATGM
jgi:endonuclease-8